MLRKLYISNYALIDCLEIDFGQGFNVITGETGAGKSILLGALSLLRGARSDSKKALDVSRKIVVEGTFETPDIGLKELFENIGLDWDDRELLLRREVAVSGRSRSFINDTPVSTAVLSEVASRLIDIHSQHQNLLIGSRNFQLDVLDALAANEARRREYQACFREYAELRRRILALKEAAAKSKENEEFIRFRLEQLKKLNPRKGEIKELERRQEILADSASLSESLSVAISMFTLSDTSILSRLHEVRGIVQSINLDLFRDEDEAETSPLTERLESTLIELTDISDTLSDYLDKVDSNPALLRKVEDRLSALYDAQRRFNVTDDEGLIALLESLEKQYESIEGSDDVLPELELQLKEKGRELREKAAELSRTRRLAAESFEARLVEMARPLGMSNLKFSAMLSAGKLTVDGQDAPAFLCAFNKNQPLMPVEKIASGGEISRLMLCLKALVASRMQLPTVVFDEVDTGVSGEIAARMAQMMKDIAAGIQVVAITHLPQVASKGDAHYKVYKEDTEVSTRTHVSLLDSEARVVETARMLGGTEVDEAALLNARSLLGLGNSCER